MRHAALSFLIAASMLLSGCVDFFTPSPEDIEEAEQADTTNGARGGANEPTPGTSDTGDGQDPGTSGSEPEPAPAENETEEPAQSETAPPNEQLQDSPDDIDRPGEYALLPNGSSNHAAKTSVPTWPDGATWTYRTKAGGNSCDQTRTVTGSDTYYEVPVYLLELRAHNCGDRNGDKQTDVPYNKADLMKIEDDGYIEHELVFPLEDGKRWRYQRQGNATVDVKVEFESGYLWNLESVSAWHVTLEYSVGNVRIEKWYGIDAKNYLREEVWVTISGAPTLLAETDLRSYDL